MGIDAGPLAGALPKLVHDGVFGKLSHVERVLEARLIDYGRDGKCLARRNIAAPIEAVDFVVQGALVAGVEVGKGAQQTHGRAAPKHGVVEQLFVAAKLDGAATHVFDGGAELAQLFG